MFWADKCGNVNSKGNTINNTTRVVKNPFVIKSPFARETGFDAEKKIRQKLIGIDFGSSIEDYNYYEWKSIC